MRMINPQLSGLRRLITRAVLIAACVMAFLGASAQDISQIGKSDPLIISGSIGTQNTYYHSSMGAGYMSPLSNTVFANLNIRIYGFSMPFSFYYSNDNMDFNYPQFSFNLTPSYKNFTAHIGQSTIPFSTYVMNMSFNGVGLEYKGSKFRTAAFYGVLRKAVNDNPEDPNPRKPQYKRIGWGFSAGYGSGNKSIDVYFLRAYDQENSIHELYRETYRPQENLVVGVKAAYAIKNFLSFNVNAATSAYTADTESEKVTVGEATKYDGIFQPRYTTTLRFAGDASVNLSTKWFSTSFYYKMVQPDYTSLGTYYTSNNYHSLGVTFGTVFFNRLSLNTNFSLQEDNLTKKQLYTTKGYVYSGVLGLRVSDKFNVNAMYNGYLQDQGDGTAVVNDTTRIHRILHSISLLPTLVLPGENLDHSFNVSGNYTINKDLNKYSIGMSDVNTLALGAGYTMNVKPWDTSFSFNLSHQQSDGYDSKYTSQVGSFTTGHSFLKERNLNTSATVSICYNEVKNTSKNLSMALDLSANYTLKKAHSFSFSASFSKYGDVNVSKTRSSLDGTDIRLSLNYVYTFTLLEIKRKAKEKK
ncbi:MAG: hypothetical protein ACI30M_08280 [Muribaculaceae bacterium]